MAGSSGSLPRSRVFDGLNFCLPQITFFEDLQTAMDDITWSTNLKLSPIQLSDVRGAFDLHVQRLMHKYISQVDGLLQKVDKSSLKIYPTNDDLSLDNPRSCLVRLHPELSSVWVRAEVIAGVFRPSVGQRLDATVRALKQHFVVCRHGRGAADLSVIVTIPRPQDGSLLTDESGAQVKLYTNDTVSIEVVQVTHAITGLVIQGRLIGILKRGVDNEINKQVTVERNLTPVVSKLDDSENKQKKRSKKRELEEKEVLKDETVIVKKKKKSTKLPEEIHISFIEANSKGTEGGTNEVERVKKKKKSKEKLQEILMEDSMVTEELIPVKKEPCDNTISRDSGDNAFAEKDDIFYVKPELDSITAPPSILNYSRSPELISDSDDPELANDSITKSEAW